MTPPPHRPPVPRLHVIGAGMAGLACAVEAVRRGLAVTVHEAAPAAGGRCRSFDDPLLDRRLDNGSHLMLAANTATRALLDLTGGWAAVTEVTPACFTFHDLRHDHGWTLRPGAGPVPWWLARADRRVPGIGALAHLRDLLRLALAGRGATVADALAGPLLTPLWQPVAEAVLNTASAEASARALWTVARDTLGRGEAACRPWLFPHGLDAALVAPCVDWLRRHGAEVRLTAPVRQVLVTEGRASGLLDRSGHTEALAPGDMVVVAAPPAAVRRLLPGLTVPDLPSRTIVNAHFRLPVPLTLPTPGFVGLIGGTAHWLFSRDDVLSVTVSAADTLAEHDDATIASILWADARRLPALRPLAGNLPPPSRVVRERRATLAHTPDAEALRPGPVTPLRGVLLAGDWTATGYPCTVEGAVRSGVRAAALAASTAHGGSEAAPKFSPH